MFKGSCKLASICASTQNNFISNRIARNSRILLNCCSSGLFLFQRRTKKDDNTNLLSSLFRPVPIKQSLDDINIGFELTGDLDKAELLKILNKFTQKKEIKILCMENGLDSKFIFFSELHKYNIIIFFFNLFRLSTTTSIC